MPGTGPILVVDDDEDIRDTIAMALGLMGYETVTAADGIDALRLIEGGLRPSLVLLDMMMPRMDGEAFLAAARANPAVADVPVVFLSGHHELGQRASSAQPDACLVKPIELDDLVDIVGKMVHARG